MFGRSLNSESLKELKIIVPDNIADISKFVSDNEKRISVLNDENANSRRQKSDIILKELFKI